MWKSAWGRPLDVVRSEDPLGHPQARHFNLAKSGNLTFFHQFEVVGFRGCPAENPFPVLVLGSSLNPRKICMLGLKATRIHLSTPQEQAEVRMAESALYRKPSLHIRMAQTCRSISEVSPGVFSGGDLAKLPARTRKPEL